MFFYYDGFGRAVLSSVSLPVVNEIEDGEDEGDDGDGGADVMPLSGKLFSHWLKIEPFTTEGRKASNASEMISEARIR